MRRFFRYIDASSKPFVLSSYNEKESNMLTKNLRDSLGVGFTPDVRIYDKVSGSENIYLSVIIKMNVDQYYDQRALDKFDANVNAIINKSFPQSKTGQLKYYYNYNGHSSTSSMMEDIK